jgi:hypothetical protein
MSSSRGWVKLRNRSRGWIYSQLTKKCLLAEASNVGHSPSEYEHVFPPTSSNTWRSWWGLHVDGSNFEIGHVVEFIVNSQNKMGCFPMIGFSLNYPNCLSWIFHQNAFLNKLLRKLKIRFFFNKEFIFGVDWCQNSSFHMVPRNYTRPENQSYMYSWIEFLIFLRNSTIKNRIFCEFTVNLTTWPFSEFDPPKIRSRWVLQEYVASRGGQGGTFRVKIHRNLVKSL